MKADYKILNKVEYELPAFLILAFKLPYSQIKSNGVSFLLISAVMAFLLGKVIRRAEQKERIYLIFFAAVFLSGDMMSTIFMPAFTDLHIIAYKLASLLCFLAAVLIIRKPLTRLQKPVFKYSLPILCIFGMLASPGFAFFYLPVILILISYEKYKTKEIKRDYTFLAVWSVPLLFIVFLILLSLFSSKKYLGLINIGFVFRILAWNSILKVLIVTLPLIIIFTMIWLNAYKTSNDKKFKRIILFCLLEPLWIVIANIFCYYAVSDGWEYYFFIAAFNQFCLLFYFWDSHEKAVAGSAGRIGGFFKKYPALLLAVVIYLAKMSDVLYRN